MKTSTLKPATEQTSPQFPGRVKAAQDVALAFRVSGTITKMHVKEGERVTKGQLLAELDDADYQVQLQATEAEYKQVKAEAERVIALYKDSGTTANAYDKAVYGLKQISAKYQHAQDEVAYTRLTAPFSGQVQKKLFDANETVGAGTPIITLVSTESPEVEINLPAADYINRHEFDEYHCTFDVYPDIQYPLQPIGIAPKANANGLYTMRLRLEVGDRPLPPPGMNTTVTIHCNEGEEQAFKVSSTALRQENGRACLFLLNKKDSTVHTVEVSVIRLLSDGESIVSGAGLKTGDEIVTSGVHHIHGGEKVQPMGEASETNVGGLL